MPDLRAGALPRDVLSASGPESGSYLQGQLSQDVLAVPAGGSSWSWLLGPNGKVDALLRVTRVSDDEWLLDTDQGWGEAVLSRLSRFKLRTKVDLEPSPRTVLAVRGPGWEDPVGRLPGIVLSPPWPGVQGADVLVEGGGAVVAGATPLTPEDYEAERILAGIPRMGAELDERTIPAETGLVPITVSFTKGCYTGQELVARIDSRGSNVPRRLRGLRFGGGAATPGEAGEAVTPGSELLGADGGPAGTVTSAVVSGTHGAVGLGYVRRGVDPGEVLSVRPVAGGPGIPVAQVELAL